MFEMTAWFYSILFIILFLAEHLYFKIAKKFGIVDIPNHRSSHNGMIIRGGGIVFPMALIILSAWNGFNDHLFFVSGLILISLVSFYDDIKPVRNSYRIIIHLISVSLLFYQTGLFEQPFWMSGLALIVIIGTINAYNFMDGINGITGGYSLILAVSLYYINEHIVHFIEPNWLIVTGLAIIVFCFFNFRNQAKCFAGDVGSVSMAYILLFFIVSLIITSSDIKFIGLLLIYGLDAVTTIVFRLIRRENIFEAHRSHFYQYLANVRRWPHLYVTVLYMILQLLVAIPLIYYDWDTLGFLLFMFSSGLVFVGVRFVVEGRDYLLYKQARP